MIAVVRFAAGRRSKWVVIAAWASLAILLAPLHSRLEREAADESETFLVRGSESAAAKRAIDERFSWGNEMTAIVAYLRDRGLTSADRRRIGADALRLCRSAKLPSLTLVGTPYQLACGRTDPNDLSPGGPSLLLSPDGDVALTSVVLENDSTPVAEAAVEAIRDTVPSPDGDRTGLRAWVTGEAGFEADRSAAVERIDETLLAVTVAALLALLIAIYRSPLVALVPIAVVAVAYVVAAGIVLGLVAAGVTEASGQSTAILIVLMFGAGTDYCLLIVARFREELRRTADVHAAMFRASERTGPAILSAGAIVVATMMVLAIADFNATREMGPILALGVAVMVCAGLTLLPAILVALGRRSFWPAIPRVEAEPRPAPAFWRRTADLVRAHPAVTAATVATVLAAGALANLPGRATLDFTEVFRDPPASVAGQRLIRERFIPGRSAPVRIVTDLDSSPKAVSALTVGSDAPATEGYLVARSPQPAELALAEATLALDPFSDRATDAIPGLRRAAREAVGGEVLIGGETAEAYDMREALARDTRLIVPVSIALIFAVLALLLRSVVMPLYVIATVALSFGFALGAGSLIFDHAFGQPASDPTLPLFAFVFLIALGVDYNVFLLARIREEHVRHPTAVAVVRALERTGGVITSAGLVLAVTFATLLAVPIESLFQIGFVVALGVLADTFLVRALLVPAIAILLGERNWWPQPRTRTSVASSTEVA